MPSNDILESFDKAMKTDSEMRKRLGFKDHESVSPSSVRIMYALLERIETLEGKR